MVTFTATQLTEETIQNLDIRCLSLDAGPIEQAYERGEKVVPKCLLPPIWMLSLRFGSDEDMIMVIPTCSVHFNALKISLHEGVGVDEDVFGKFD